MKLSTIEAILSSLGFYESFIGIWESEDFMTSFDTNSDIAVLSDGNGDHLGYLNTESATALCVFNFVEKGTAQEFREDCPF